MTTGENDASLSRQIIFLHVALVYFLIFSSGSLRYNQADDQFLVVGFIITFVAWLFYTDRKFSSGFLLYCISFAGMLFALSIYTGGSLSLQGVISIMLKLLLSYLVIKTVGEKFAVTFVRVVVFLAAVSLLGFLSDTLHLFDGLVQKLPVVSSRAYDGIFYLFRDGYHPYRNQSIFFEPGAYQGFLNAALFILFFVNLDIGKRKQWIYILILLAALVTALSTTGFMIFLCSFALFLYKSEISTFYGKFIMVGLAVVVVVLFAAQFHERFVKKIDDYLSANEYDFSWSAQTRSSQMKADIKVIKKHVFGLGIKDYLKEFKLEGRTDNQGSSNGVTRILAMYGLPIGLFIFGTYLWAMKRLLHDPVLVTGAFVMFMLFLGGQSYYISTPMSYALISAAFVYGHKYAGAVVQKQAV
jgi:uncharacterized membrane protein